MAVIKDATSSTTLAVDPTSKAARVTLYNPDGTTATPAPVGSYVAQFIKLRSAAAPTAGALLWVMANAATRTARVRRILLNCAFDGVATATNSQAYEFVRITSGAAVAWNTGTELVKDKKKTTYPASTLQTVRQNAGNAITLPAGVAVPAEGFATFGVPRSVSGVSTAYVWEFGDASINLFELAAYEGIGLVSRVAGIAGDFVSGFIEWDEV